MPVEAGVSLEDDEDDVRGPAHESQNHAAAQEEPVVVVVVHQALQGVGDQSLALGDLLGEQAEGRRSHTPQGAQVAVILFQTIKSELVAFLNNSPLHHTSPAESGFWPYGQILLA